MCWCMVQDFIYVFYGWERFQLNIVATFIFKYAIVCEMSLSWQGLSLSDSWLTANIPVIINHRPYNPSSYRSANHKVLTHIQSQSNLAPLSPSLSINFSFFILQSFGNKRFFVMILLIPIMLTFLWLLSLGWQYDMTLPLVETSPPGYFYLNKPRA